MSKITKNFEKQFAKKLGCKYALMTNSGSSANLLAVSAIINPMFKNKLKAGDEVLIPSVCWSTSLWPIVQNNLKPVFVDVELNTFNISVEDLKKKITSKTKAIICVHVLGTSANLNQIKKIINKKNIIFIEDTCESLGAKFIMVEDEESRQAETAGGYAKEMSEKYKHKQSQLLAETISKQDIVICTALIPGKPAPVLVTPEMVETMSTGSVIVDLAVEAGGNCPLSKIGEVVVHNGVKILGYANVPGRVAKDASSLYAKNIVNFLYLMIDKEEKKIDIDWNDEIINAVVLSHNGNIKLEKFI